MKRSSGFLVLLTALASACEGSSDGVDGQGTVTFTTWGEEYIEQEIPAKSPQGEVIIEDGWTVKYERFLIVLGDVSVGEDGKPPAATLPTPKLFDMHAPGEKPVIAFPNLPGKAYNVVSYAVVPATAATQVAEGASDADKQMMIASNYSLWVKGSFSKEGTTKAFTWGFRTNTLYDRCKGEVSGKETDGVVVTNGGNDTVQLTIHGDHLFYDDLQAPEAKVRLDTIAAADADGDGEVTLAELEAVDLADRTKIKAGPYGTGSAAGINNLRTFVEALTRTLGHFRGEGECLARSRDRLN